VHGLKKEKNQTDPFSKERNSSSECLAVLAAALPVKLMHLTTHHSSHAMVVLVLCGG
jgi:hypothetical protein